MRASICLPCSAFLRILLTSIAHSNLIVAAYIFYSYTASALLHTPVYQLSPSTEVHSSLHVLCWQYLWVQYDMLVRHLCVQSQLLGSKQGALTSTLLRNITFRWCIFFRVPQCSIILVLGIHSSLTLMALGAISIPAVPPFNDFSLTDSCPVTTIWLLRLL